MAEIESGWSDRRSSQKTPDQYAGLIRSIIAEEASRAGVYNPTLADDFLSGDPKAREYVSSLLYSGDPDTDGVEGGEWPEIRKKQMEGFKGRGWSASEMADWRSKNGPTIPDRLLSEGSKQAYRWQANRDFLRGFVDLEKSTNSQSRNNQPSLSSLLLGGPFTGMVGNPHQKDYEAGLHRLSENHNRQINSDYGESGWTGFLNNPEEYAVPWVIDNVFDRGFHAFDYGRQKDKEGNRRGFFNSLVSDVPKYLSARAAAGQVSPALPGNPKTPEEREAALKSLHGMRDAANPNSPKGPTSYEMGHREDTGHYPSYAGSTLVNFLQGLVSDPTVVANVGMAGRAALTAAKAGTRESARAAVRAAIAAGRRETGEEAAMGTAIAGPITLYNESEQAKVPKQDRQSVNWKNLFTPGNEVRTDLPKDVREESQADFIKRYDSEYEARRQALKAVPETLKSIPTKRPLGRLNATPAM